MHSYNRKRVLDWTNEAVVTIKVIIAKTVRGLLNGIIMSLIFRYVVLLKLDKSFVKVEFTLFPCLDN